MIFMDVSYSFTYNRRPTELLNSNIGIVVQCDYCKENIVTTPHRYMRGKTAHICRGFYVFNKFYSEDEMPAEPKISE